MSDCLFCKIVVGEIPATVVAESERVLAIDDIAPQAPVHVLIMPKTHVESADTVASSDADVVAEMILLAQRVAASEGVKESGYRLVCNVGADGQMTVAHLHMHLLGGRRLEWPPG